MSTEKVDFWLGIAALLISCMPWWITLMPLLLTFSDDILKNTVLYKSKCVMYVICYTLSRLVQLDSAFILHNVTDLDSVRLGVLGIMICIFNVSEYLLTAYTIPESVSLRSFCFLFKWTHLSIATASAAEIFIKKQLPWDLGSVQKILFFVGLGLTVVGEGWMLKARIDAGSNFHSSTRLPWEREHELVTNGVYRLCRHPWYFGWTIWTLGLQVMLSNPLTSVCTLVTNAVILRRKITIEELVLKQTHDDYLAYSMTTGLFPRGFNWVIGGSQL